MTRADLIDASVRRAFIKFFPKSHRTHMAEALVSGSVNPRLEVAILTAWDRLNRKAA